jgi:LAS superfamily LD-carboxypeptidase LdcB
MAKQQDDKNGILTKSLPTTPRQPYGVSTDVTSSNFLNVPGMTEEVKEENLHQDVEDREETSATLTHVDRRGRTLSLNMRKTCFDTQGKQANVVFIRDDADSNPKAGGKVEVEEKNAIDRRSSLFGAYEDAIKIRERASWVRF